MFELILTRNSNRKVRSKEAEKLEPREQQNAVSVELREKAGVGNFNRLDIFRLC